MHTYVQLCPSVDQQTMSYRYVYPNGTPAVGAVPVNGYTMDPAVMAAGYPNGVPTNMYNSHRRR